jgi:2-hydroxy-3-oxopropionate reductase
MIDTIGFIGLGVMGAPMARNLLNAGFRLVVHSRSPAPVERLVVAGAQAAENPAAVAARADTLVTMLPDSGDVQQVLAGPAGVFERVRPGSVLIDMSSIRPAVARELAAEAARRGATLLDAPVSGGEIGAVNASLSIMVGGDRAALDRVRPVLNAMGNPERVVYIGESGAGQVAKLCNQMAIGGTLAAVGEAFALARKAGVDPARVREALLGGFAASRVLDVHGQRILDEDYKPGFRARLYYKDMGNAIDTARFYETPAPVSALVQQLLAALLASGQGDADYSALATVFFGLAGCGVRS